jgi:hypothetical protein
MRQLTGIRRTGIGMNESIETKDSIKAGDLVRRMGALAAADQAICNQQQASRQSQLEEPHDHSR